MGRLGFVVRFANPASYNRTKKCGNRQKTLLPIKTGQLRRNVGGHLRDTINSTLNVYYEMLNTGDKIITYHKAKQIADIAKGVAVT